MRGVKSIFQNPSHEKYPSHSPDVNLICTYGLSFTIEYSQNLGKYQSFKNGFEIRMGENFLIRSNQS